jgi:hypothetical protein
MRTTRNFTRIEYFNTRMNKTIRIWNYWDELSEDQIINGNKIIAEYMGASEWKKGKERFDLNENGQYIEEYIPDGFNYDTHKIWKQDIIAEKFHYNDSWDWLLPAINKFIKSYEPSKTFNYHDKTYSDILVSSVFENNMKNAFVNLYEAIQYHNEQFIKEAYSENITEVINPKFGIDKNGEVTYDAKKACGHPNFYEVESQSEDDLKNLFKKGYKIYILKGYPNRGAAIDMKSRENFIQKYGFINFEELNQIIINELSYNLSNTI